MLYFNSRWLPHYHSVCIVFLVYFVTLPFCGQEGRGVSAPLIFRVAVGLFFCFVFLNVQEGRDISVSGGMSA